MWILNLLRAIARVIARNTAVLLVGVLAATAVYGLGYVGTAPAAEAAPAPSVVRVSAESTPDDLWDALRAQGFTGVQGDGCECLYVGVGVQVDTPGRVYTVTEHGFAVCEDWVTTGSEC